MEAEEELSVATSEHLEDESEIEETQEIPIEPSLVGDDEISEEDDEGSADNAIISGVKNMTKFELVPFQETYSNYYTVNRLTKPYITKYERAKVIGIRAEQIASGDNAFIPVPKGITDCYQIARMEFEAKKSPVLIRRYHPNGEYEDWRLEDLIFLK